jgi:hypothetical protein
MITNDLDAIESKVVQLLHDSGVIKDASAEDALDEAIEHTSFIQCNDFKDVDLGHVLIVMIQICEIKGTSIETCLTAAYKELKK